MKSAKQIITTALVSLSVIAFAGECPTLSGKYIIGKSANADFASINEATEALNCGGVDGRVDFKIEKGIYNEKVALSAISGASALNSITFESVTGNNDDVVISYASTDVTLVMNGVSYVSFENITIDHQTAVYGNSMRVDGKASNLAFKNVIFNGVEVARTGSNSAAVYFTGSAAKNDIIFDACEVNNGSTGIAKGGYNADNKDSKTTITGTLFFNQYETGLALSNEDAPVVSNNVVSSLSSYNGFKAMSFDDISGNMVISTNVLNNANGTYGLVLNNCNSSASAFGQVSNNSINVGGNEAYGVVLTGNTDNQVLNFNRIKLSINGKMTATQAYYKNSGTGNNINLMNCIMYDLNSGSYTIVGNTYKDYFNQLPAHSNAAMTASANGLMIEKVTAIR